MQKITNTQRKSERALNVIQKAISEGRKSLLEYESEAVAKEYGISVAQGELATNEDEALKVARRIGFPLVMKIVSPDILHKSDIGGVKTDVGSEVDVRKSFKEILNNAKTKDKARIIGIYVQRMAPKANEFVVGGLRDPQFGPTVMFGLGGIYVEIFKDVSLRLAPLSKEEAVSMVKEIKSAPLLMGFRGSKPLDLDSVGRTIVAVGEIMNNLNDVDSIDINPLLVYEKGTIAVDVRIILKG
jgi:acyl-CoA synthetase (NDP forming)